MICMDGGNDDNLNWIVTFGVLRKNGHFMMFGFIQVTHCALDMICETAMGRSINANDEIK